MRTKAEEIPREAAQDDRIPSTAGIDEVAYQQATLALFRRLFPEKDSESFLLGYALSRVGNRYRAGLDAAVHQPNDHSDAQMRILTCLAAVGPTTPTELARLTQVSPSSVSSVLRTLKRSGHVTQDVPNYEVDGRIRIVRITPAGDEMMKRIMGASWPIGERLVGFLSTEERAALVRMLLRLAKALE